MREWIDLGQLIRENKVKSETAGLSAMQTLSGGLGMDISWGRLGAKDLEKLGMRAKNVHLRAGGCTCPKLLRLRIGCLQFQFFSVTFFFDIVKSALTHDLLDSKAFQVRQASGQVLDDAELARLSTRPNSIRQPSQPPSHTSTPTASQDDLCSTTIFVLPTESKPKEGVQTDHEDESANLIHGAGEMMREKNGRLLLANRSNTLGKGMSSSLNRHRHSSSHLNLTLLEKLWKSQEPVGLFESHR